MHSNESALCVCVCVCERERERDQRATRVSRLENEAATMSNENSLRMPTSLMLTDPPAPSNSLF